jgi:SnoaL-like domain
MDPGEELVALEVIKKVKHQYAHNLDAKQLDELVALFTEDAVCEFGRAYGQWTGRDEIRPAGEGVAKNPGQEGRFQRVGDLRGLTAWWARTETVPSRGEVRQNRPAIGATAGIEQQET